jgi:hypothetical protein
MRILRKRQQRWKRTGVFQSLQGKRHRPPADARLSTVEHRGGELVVGIEPDQRVHR